MRRDPIEEAGGENLYVCAANSLVNRWDLLGLVDKTVTNSVVQLPDITKDCLCGKVIVVAYIDADAASGNDAPW